MYLNVVTIGKMAPTWNEMSYSVIYGVYAKIPWIGFLKFNRLKWFALGKFAYEPNLWTHTCVGVDLKQGNVKLFENGKKVYDDKIEALSEWTKDMPREIDTVTVGCAVRTEEDRNMSMLGKITDFNVWGEILGDDELVGFGKCQTVANLNYIIEWTSQTWSLTTRKNYTTLEKLRRESTICFVPSKSHILIPIRRPIFDQAGNVCEKFSGKLASYVTEKEFVELQHVMFQNIPRSKNCQQKVEAGRTMYRTWLAITDLAEEGNFVDMYTNKSIQYRPWAAGRPFQDSHHYNCLASVVLFSQKFEDLKFEIRDQNCYGEQFCYICEILQPNLRVHVRGLCKESILDKSYIFNVNEKGYPYYIGQRSSSITYNEETKLWIWSDRNYNSSFATSSMELKSLLLGVVPVNFENFQEACPEARKNKILLLKLSSCGKDQFTCSDGQCISMYRRCDQTPQCSDESDEKDCKMIVMNENYNSKLPPHRFASRVGPDPANKCFYFSPCSKGDENIRN